MPGKSSHSNYAGCKKSAVTLFASSTHLLSHNRSFRVIEGSESIKIRVYAKVVV